MKMIDSNAAIVGTLKVAMDIFTLAHGRQNGAIPATTLERLARGDKSSRFQTRGRSKRFWSNEPTILLQQ
jgi:NADPH-dependent glutamate synthase beta subunit-like oxidoreductase